MKAQFIIFMGLLTGVFVAHAGDVTPLIKEGDKFETQFQVEKALAVYQEADKEDPNDTKVLHRIAREYAEMMTPNLSQDEQLSLGKKALSYAERAVQAGPGNAKAHLALAICLGRVAPLLDNKTKISYSKRIREEAEKSISLDPGDDRAYYVIGAWNYEIADLKPFLRELAKMIYGDMPDGSYERAVEDFKKAIALNPRRLASHVELGRTYLAMGKKEEAVAELKKGLNMPEKEKDDADTKARAREALAKL